ncbi:MAG: methyltransferase domain-containing protein [Planctomycetota bacterium]|nr:methyltransferase domain-containing protein [Planctomycetota bacterium]
MSDHGATARDVAVRALRDRGGNVTAHVDRFAGTNAPPAEKALARELALGVLRRRGTLDAVLRAYLRQADRRPPGPVQEILQVALYQLLFLDRVPDFAAVSEAVAQTGRFGHNRQSKFVNGVLRGITRELSAAAEEGLPPAADVIPTSPRAGRRIGREVFPSPADDPGGYLAAAYSLPESLAGRWVARFGGLAGALPIAAQAAARAPLLVRPNTLKGSVEEILAALQTEGAQAQLHAGGRCIVLEGVANVQQMAALKAGLIQPQDATAAAVAPACEVQPGMNVLDFCAAPGTKTTHLAERMANRGRIVALDVSQEKLSRIDDSCRRMGISIVTTMLAENVAQLPEASFDLALVDAPCSNTGVLARRAEARWRCDDRSFSALAADQQILAGLAARYVRPGGRLVYSTCSIEPEECGELARALVKKNPRLKLVRDELTLPGGADEPACWRDGGYTAIFDVR